MLQSPRYVRHACVQEEYHDWHSPQPAADDVGTFLLCGSYPGSRRAGGASADFIAGPAASSRWCSTWARWTSHGTAPTGDPPCAICQISWVLGGILGVGLSRASIGPRSRAQGLLLRGKELADRTDLVRRISPSVLLYLGFNCPLVDFAQGNEASDRLRWTIATIYGTIYGAVLGIPRPSNRMNSAVWHARMRSIRPR